jgi:hypothetical protein
LKDYSPETGALGEREPQNGIFTSFALKQSQDLDTRQDGRKSGGT